MGRAKKNPVNSVESNKLSELYAVVKFYENDNILFECIPHIWFTNEEKTECYWPPKKGKPLYVRSFKREIPDETWEICICEVVREGLATYSIGRTIVREKCNQSYNTSSADDHLSDAKFRRNHPGLTLDEPKNFDHVFTASKTIVLNVMEKTTKENVKQNSQAVVDVSAAGPSDAHNISTIGVNPSTNNGRVSENSSESRKRRRSSANSSQTSRSRNIRSRSSSSQHSRNSNTSRIRRSKSRDNQQSRSRSNASSNRRPRSHESNSSQHPQFKNRRLSSTNSRQNQKDSSSNAHQSRRVSPGNRHRSRRSPSSNHTIRSFTSANSRRPRNQKDSSFNAHQVFRLSPGGGHRSSQSLINKKSIRSPCHTRQVQSSLPSTNSRQNQKDSSSNAHRSRRSPSSNHTFRSFTSTNSRRRLSPVGSHRSRQNHNNTNKIQTTTSSKYGSRYNRHRSSSEDRQSQQPSYNISGLKLCLPSCESKQLVSVFIRKIDDLKDVIYKSNCQNERRSSRMEVTLNKTFIRLSDVTRTNDNYTRHTPERNDNLMGTSRRQFKVPDFPIMDLRELTDLTKKLKNNEFKTFLVDREKDFCTPSKTKTNNVIITAYLKRFISLDVRQQINFKDAKEDTDKTLFGNYQQIYQFLIEVMRAGYKSGDKNITVEDAHLALRIVWGRTKQILNEERHKKCNYRMGAQQKHQRRSKNF